MDFISLLDKYGWPVGSLIFAVFAFYSDMIVTGKRFRNREAELLERQELIRQESDEWKKLALELGGITGKALSIADRHVPRKRSD